MTVSKPPLDTVVSCLTPPGTGAIAVLAVHGPDAWKTTARLFRRRSASQETMSDPPTVGQIRLGKIGEGASDEVVMAVRQLEPTPWLEFQVHGGREVIRWVIDTVEAEGIRSCEWHELVKRTSDNSLYGKSCIALSEASTVRTASILHDQVHGAFGGELETIGRLIAGNSVHDAVAAVNDLMSYAPLGCHLTKPWRVVVAGAPNVGKSSLVNALAGFQRSIVAPMPGTTRDVVWTPIAIDGWPVDMADTAGLRASMEHLEDAGIRMAQDAAASADLCVWVLDGSADPVWPDRASTNVLVVINKIDLAPHWEHANAGDAICVSALTGAGLGELCAAISRRLVADIPPPGAAVPFTAELCDQLREIQRLMDEDNVAAATQVLDALQNDFLDCSQSTDDGGVIAG